LFAEPVLLVAPTPGRAGTGLLGFGHEKARQTSGAGRAGCRGRTFRDHNEFLTIFLLNLQLYLLTFV
jgi:hypothetical protein